ncbi:MAG: tryptophan synthase subunit alpha [Proteobacteria bacterium]|nr:tryptophan synthase subunit alpha [Pseudomonadota bacterium]MBW3617184.1 tryptophan synthase subunit alpha [Pseudomonadota bacterium]
MSVARLDARFALCRAEDRAAFVAYLMAGDPDAGRSLALLRGLSAAGADVIELGFPFSDPMAEGPPIQRASLRALEAGTTLASTLELVRRFRAGERDTPLILMGYLNPVLSYGYDRFSSDAAEAGVDGLLVVDCPPEEADDLADALDPHGLALVRLAAPTTDAARLPAVVRRASGFVYYVSVAGVTGVKSAAAETVAPAVERIRAAAGGLPVAVGFGIRTPEQAAAVAQAADAVVVGSALVDTLAKHGVEAALGQASALAQAVRNARR